jgi:hypothetical protein
LKIILPIIATLFLISCTSSGVIQTGDNTYIISKRSTGGGFVTGSGAKSDLYKEASKYCENSGKFVETIKVNTADGIPFVRIAGAELEFKCVSPVSNN